MSSSFAKDFDVNRDRFVSEWSDFLRFPTIGAQPEHDDDCFACAEWLRDHLEAIGMEARLEQTSTKPLVLAKYKGKESKPTILVYGHYDVQPVDPLEGWTTEPFDPQIRNGRLYARGAEDNKGQLFYVVKAIETLIKNETLDCTVKVLFEGEEEFGGSSGLSECLKRNAAELTADILMVTDVGRVPSNEPTIIMGLRGIISLTAKLTGASYDLHSGMHGGIAPNPATGMSRIVASFHDAAGNVAVDGFTDGAKPASDSERKLASTTSFDPATYESHTGVLPVAGNNDFTPVERLGFLPTIEVNGIHSGYGGSGGKTIIPSDAIAKISCRLVAGQDPEKALAAICSHIEKHRPKGLKLEISDKMIGGSALRIDPSTRPVKIAADVLKKITGQAPVYYYEGASIPIIPELSSAAGADPILVGFGTEEGRAHAPNESFAIEDFKLGFLYACEFLSSL